MSKELVQQEPQGPRYSLQTQADSIFGFLRQTFNQMPRSVQVFGWLVFLFLFVLLILYPLFGITYFQGKVIVLAIDEEARPSARGLRVVKGIHTYTNDEGEFTLALRLPSIPLLTIDFDIGDPKHKQVLSIPTQLPFVSLFDPNARKIYYVPSSKTRDKFDQIQYYFLDGDEAARAFKNSTKQGGEARIFPVSSSALPQLALSDWAIRSARAAEERYDAPKYTLRFHQFRLPNMREDAVEAFFGIRMNGRPVELPGIPTTNTRTIDRLTLVAGAWVRVDEFDIPLPSPNVTVDVDVFSGGIFRSSNIASITVPVAKASVGQKFRLEGQNISVECELLPPVAIGSFATETGRGHRTAFWLDTPNEFMNQIARVTFSSGALQLPQGLRERAYGVIINSSGPITSKARVVFSTGSILRLASQSGMAKGDLKTSMQLYWAADIYRRDGEESQALNLVEKALAIDASADWAYQTKGAILRNLDKLDESFASYERALQIAPNSVMARVGYALTVAEKPGTNKNQLLYAQQLVNDALKLMPEYEFSYIALGALKVRLGEVSSALEHLSSAEKIEVQGGRSQSPALQNIYYTRGLAYRTLRKPEEARAAFQLVLDQSEKGVIGPGSEKLVKYAKKELQGL